MIVRLKVKYHEMGTNGMLFMITNAEWYVEMLSKHSPNLLIQCLNKYHGTKIAELPNHKKHKKEAQDGTL
ncbi:MAG: hypothetical protein ACRCZB_02825 [Bacteroidales bacterium]